MTSTELLIKVSEFEDDRYVIEIDNKKYDMIKVVTVTGGGGGALSLVDFYYSCIPVEESE